MSHTCWLSGDFSDAFENISFDGGSSIFCDFAVHFMRFSTTQGLTRKPKSRCNMNDSICTCLGYFNYSNVCYIVRVSASEFPCNSSVSGKVQGG